MALEVSTGEGDQETNIEGTLNLHLHTRANELSTHKPSGLCCLGAFGYVITNNQSYPTLKSLNLHVFTKRNALDYLAGFTNTHYT